MLYWQCIWLDHLNAEPPENNSARPPRNQLDPKLRETSNTYGREPSNLMRKGSGATLVKTIPKELQWEHPQFKKILLFNLENTK